ncbi:MAG: lipid asymmetry maintenance ABC transporter permease subunit MlaE [Pseudomonadales bacterium]|nr:lipid asymmetry maintenance ABC transporter permease subunit MlaE [Pseudomonadales bacterium]MCP5185379.1 lipid asymmetry maintenance ABC transporter permease subunit MlaE [Pseudomonadales bacterium]
MQNLLRRIGSRVLAWLQGLGRASVMWVLAMSWVPRWSEWHLLIRQVYSIGVLSLAIISLSAFAIGSVIALQFYTQLTRFGAEDAVGAGLALVLLRELGPVVTGLLFAGRAGSAITAEIGLMKTTEQLSIMEMMGVDPLRRIVAPRLWGGVISMPLLTAVFNVVAIYGGYVVGVQWLGADPGGFWSGMQDAVEVWQDIGKGMIKAGVFAVVVTWIAVFQGYDCEPTAEGMGLATTRTVVSASVLILAIDFFLSLVMYGEFR